MDTFTAAIQKYLRENNELDAAKFLDGCIVENRFKDLVSGLNDDYDTELYDMIVFVPVRRFHEMDSTKSKIVETIEKAISEYTEASGRAMYSIQWKPYLRDDDDEKIESKTVDVIKLLSDNQYVTSKIQVLKDNIDKAPHLAIGTAKELIEVCCKGILSHNGMVPDVNWDLPRLVKETNKVMNFVGDTEDEKLRQSVHMIVGGLANIVHGVTEVRNRFGSGHGHDLNFKELDQAYTHLTVYSSIEFVTFYLRVFQSQKNKNDS